MVPLRSARDSLPRFTDRLSVGAAGLSVSPFCLGLVRTEETISAAFDAGINFFFLTTDMHWPLYDAARRGLAKLLARGNGIRDQIVVAGVCYPTQLEFCWMPFRELLDAVPSLERIDVLVAGGSYGHEIDARLTVYHEMRRTGYLGARAIGTTFHDRQAAVRAMQDNQVDLAFIRYNPAHPGARQDVFPHVPHHRSTLLFNFKSTLGYVPPDAMARLGLDGAVYWHPDITDHYRFVLTRPEMDGLLISLDTPEQVRSLAAALERGPLDEEEEEYLMSAALVAQGKAKVDSEEEVTSTSHDQV